MSTEANHGGIYIPGRDVRASRQPVVRDAIETFLSYVDPTMTETALQRVLEADDGSTIVSTVKEFVEPSALIMNPVVSGVGVSQELLLMNSPKLWNFLLTDAAKKDKIAISGFAGIDPLIEDGELLTKWGGMIANGNRELFGAALMYSAMAAVYGEKQYPHAITTKGKYGGTLITGKEYDERFAAGMELSKLFPTPALSVGETISRLRTIFPAKATSYDDIPAFRVVKGKKAFTSLTPYDIPQAVTCPADGMTGMLFTAYGNILAKPEYQQKLRAKFVPRLPGLPA
jgi:hypothetical protein